MDLGRFAAPNLTKLYKVIQKATDRRSGIKMKAKDKCCKGKLHDHCCKGEAGPFYKTQPTNKETHICEHNSIDLVRSTKSWMYFTGGPYKGKALKKESMNIL